MQLGPVLSQYYKYYFRKPYLGHVDIHYSARHPGELGILQRFCFSWINWIESILLHHDDDDDDEPKPF